MLELTTYKHGPSSPPSARDMSPVPHSGRPQMERSQSEQSVPPDGPASPSHLRPAPVFTQTQTPTTTALPAPFAPAPRRPARHPARAHASPLVAPVPLVPNMVNKLIAQDTARPRTATGSREDVTPWELFPAPDDEPSRPTTATKLRASAMSMRPSSSGGRPSSSGGRPSGLHLPDGLVRRRKSTGTKALASMGNRQSVASPTTRSTVSATSPLKPHPDIYLGNLAGGSPVPILPPPLPKKKPSHPVPTLRPSAFSETQHQIQKEREQENQLKFSTADRTILEELKRNISARAAQFVVKGGLSGCKKPGFGPDGGHGWGAGTLGGLGIMGGRKHHPFAKEEVPYPRSYERDVLDLDIWETAFCQQICDSMTWHVFDDPPKKVLDIGCGSGAWILNCARTWRDSSFVGLDVVPLHPDLHQVGSIDLAQRITWTQGNFLEFLPFPNEEFDYVHIKRIALGVPEDKWDHLFEEIIRVMKPGGAFEIIEEDLFFPGRPPDDPDDESDFGSDDRRHSANSIPHSDVTRSSDQDINESDTDTIPTSLYDSGISVSMRKSEDVGRPLSNGSGIFRSASTTSLTSPISGIPVSETAIVEDDEESTEANGGTITQATHAVRKSLSFGMPNGATSHRNSFSMSTGGDKPAPPTPSRIYSGSSISLQATTTNSLDAAVLETRTRRLSMVVSSPTNPSFPPSIVDFSTRNSSNTRSKPPPFLSRPIKPPVNPRDHTVLETIWSEMQAARFINMSPLSLLPNHLSLHFTDVRTHPPIQFAFPPLPEPKVAAPQPEDEGDDTDMDPDEEARNAINPHPAKPMERRRLSIDTSVAGGGDGARWISARGLLEKSSQLITFDDSRLSGFAPSKATAAASSPTSPTHTSSLGSGSGPADPSLGLGVDGLPPPPLPPPPPQLNGSPMSPLMKNAFPNKRLHIDMRTLNLHLALRTAEVLACAEEMWEWVVEYQAEVRRRRREEASAMRREARSKSADSHRGRERRGGVVSQKVETGLGEGAGEGPKGVIAGLDRDEFEGLLARFDMDMRDHMALGGQLESRFSWTSFPGKEENGERKVFDDACEKYRQWEEESKRRRTGGGGGAGGYEFPTHASGKGAQELLISESAPRRGTSTSTRRLCRTMGVFVAWKSMDARSGDDD